MFPFFQRSSLLILLCLLSVSVLVAQTACPTFVQEALNSVGENCASLGRNEVCYGYDQVQASFLVPVADDFFSQPSSVTPLADIETIRTLAYSEEEGILGIAVMNMQANVPNTLPGQNVTFVLVGDVEVENAVAPEDAFAPVEAISVRLNVESANLRSGAGLNFNVLAGIRQGDTILADGISEDGDWLRVTRNNRFGWLFRDLVIADAAIDSLPTLSEDLNTPMQAFYLRTGIGQPACEEAPNNSLLVQGPENIEIEITVNGVDVRLGSSGVFQVIEQDGEIYLEVSVFDGEFQIGAESIFRGQRSQICLGDAESRGLDGEANDLIATCEPSEPETIPSGEWCNLEAISDEVLNYALDVPCPDDTPVPTSNNSQGSNSNLAEVDCSNFSITTGQVIATDFTLSWTAATGADSYEVAGIDENGNQIFSAFTTGTSLATNGGSFPPAGAVDVRAYRNGQYACFARLTYVRAVDPNEANYASPSSGSLTVSVTCNFDGSADMVGLVTWSGLPAGETITGTLTTFSPAGSDSQNSMASSGTMNLSINTGFPTGATIVATTTGGYTQNGSC